MLNYWVNWIFYNLTRVYELNYNICCKNLNNLFLDFKQNLKIDYLNL